MELNLLFRKNVLYPHAFEKYIEFGRGLGWCLRECVTLTEDTGSSTH